MSADCKAFGGGKEIAYGGKFGHSTSASFAVGNPRNVDLNLIVATLVPAQATA